MAQRLKVSTYIRNVGKSFGYAVGDTVGEILPVVRDVARDTKSTYQDAKTSIKEINNSIRNAAKNFGGESNLLSNTLDDLKSGNWYNKEREDHALDDMFGDFDFDDDWGDSSFSNDDTDDMLENDDKNTRQIMNSMDSLGATVSKSVAYSNAKSAEYIVANNKAASKAMYELTGRGFNQISNILLGMNDTMGALVRLGEPISNHIQNSSVFYTNTTESLNKISQSLETLVKRTEYMDKINQQASSKNKKDISRFMYGGDFSMSGYIDMVKENVQEQTDMIKGFMDLLGMSVGKNGKNTSITTLATKGLISKIIPEFAKATAEQFNEAFNNALGNGIMRVSRKANKSGNFLVNLLSGLFLPTDRLKTDFDTSKYEKGAMQWDGIAKKALVDVIPTYLAKINAQLGGEERYFNYSTGKYESIKTTRARREAIYTESAIASGGEFRREALKEAGDNEAIKKQIEAFFLNAIKSDEEFYDLAKIKKMNRGSDRDKKLKALGITDEAALDTLLRVIEMANAGQYGSKNRNMMSNFERSVWRSRADISQTLRDRETGGYDIEGRLYDDWSSEGTASSGKRGRRNRNTKEGQRYRTSSGSFASKAYGESGVTYFIVNGVILSQNEYDMYQAKLTYDPNGAKKILASAKSSIEALKRKRDISNAQRNTNSDIMNAIRNVGEEENGGKRKVSKFLHSLVEEPFRVVSMAMDSLTKGINTLFWGDGNFDGLFNKITDKFKEITETVKNKIKEWLEVDDENEDSLKNSMKRQLVSMGTNAMNRASNWLERKNAPRRGRIAGAQAAAEWQASMDSNYMPEGTGSGLIAGGDSGLDEARSRLLNEGSFYIGTGMGKLRTGFGEFLSRSLFGENPEEEKQKIMRNIDENLKSSFKDIPGAKGAIGIGAITGVGVSLLTGAVVGPLAGAAIGGAVGLAAKSQSFQNFLFGEGDPNSDDYKKGIMGEFGRKLKADGFKNAKGTGIGGLAGIVGGTLMGSPILGAMVGSAAGYVATSEKAKNYLFGKVGENGERDNTGLFKAETLKKLKAAAPNMGAGALAGLLVGPFGVVGNLAVGAGVGYLSTSQKFHNFIFGDPDNDEDKGLAGAIHDKIVNPIDEIMHNMSIRIGTFMKNMGKSIGNKISSFFNDRVKRYKDGDRSSLIGNILGFGQKVASTPFNMLTGALGNIATRSRNKNLNRGYGVWNKDENRLATAAEREQMRADAGLRSSALDQAIASARSTEELKELQKALKDLEDPGRIFKSLRNKSLSDLYKVLEENGVSSKDADKITTLVKGDNGASRAIQYLKTCELKTVEGKSPIKQVEDIETAIRTANNQILEAKNDKNITKGTKALLRDKYGIDSSNIDLMNADDLINSELKHRSSLSPEAIANAEDRQYHSNVESYLDKILNSINGNRNGAQSTFNRQHAGRIINKPDKNGVMRYYQLDENGKMKRISKEAAESYNLRDDNRSLTESLYDTGEYVGDVAGAAGRVAIDKVVTAGRAINAAASAMVHAAQAVGSFAVGQVENGVALADEAASDLVDSDVNTNGSYATGGIFNRLGTSVRSKFSRIKGFARGLVSINNEETSGEGSKLRRLLSGGAGEEKRTEFTPNGPIQYIKSAQGEWVTDKADRETKETIKKQETFNDAISSVTKIPSLLGSLGGMFGKLKEGLIGEDGDGDKKGILGLIGGMAGGLFTLFTGKELSLKGFVGRFAKKFVSKNLLKTVASDLIGPGLLAAGLSGKFDQLASDLTNDAYNNESKSEARVYTAETEDGEIVEVKKDEDGNYVDPKTGQQVNNVTRIISSHTNRASFGDKLKENIGRGLLTGRASVATYALARTSIGKAVTKSGILKDITKAVSKNADDYARLAVQGGIVDGLSKVATKLTPILVKFGVDPDTTQAMFAKLGTTIADKLTGEAAKKVANTIGTVIVIAKIAFAVIDFTTGYQDAKTTFGIIDEPTFGQKVISGLIRVVKNLIPIVGTLIPDSLVLDVFCEFLAPVFGIDIDELKSQRAHAKEEAAANGYSSVGDYIKEGLGEYTWTENLSNGWHTAVENIKNNSKKSTDAGAKKIQNVVNSHMSIANPYGTTSTSTATKPVVVVPVATSPYAVTQTTANKSTKTAVSTNPMNSFIAGGASGFVSQFDPRYQQYRIGGSNFAGKGCGPAVAAMAASALGKNLSVGNAVSASNGYQTSGGVTLDYFQNALGSQGIDTQVIAGGGAGDLYSSIAHGKKVILLGQDASNTSKAYSPFGPNNHYVLATGLDRRGNIIVNDPESNGPRTYSPGILRNTKYGVVAGRGSGIRRYNRNLLRRFAGGASVANNEITQQIWAYLTTKLGMSESAAAGVMGNMQAESGCQPDRKQKGGSAYGLCQWDNDRKYKLMALPNYTALSTQLDYMASELPSQPWKSSGVVDDIDGKSYNYSGMTYEEFKRLTDVAIATIKFEAAFERAGKPRLANRINFAKEFYEMFTGKEYVYDESIASSSTGTEESGSIGSSKSKTSSLGLLGTISNAFSKAFGKVFNGGDDDESSGISYGNSNGGFATNGESFDVASANFSGKTPSEIMKSILGKIAYDMKGPRDPEQGSADCSSTVRWAIKKAGGPDIGGNSSAQYNNKNLKTVWYGNGGYADSLPSNIQPNDVLFFARPNSDHAKNNPDMVGHVGIYEGDGKYIDHGGKGPGPNEKTLKFGDAGKLIKVSRVDTSAAGSGILNYSDLARKAAGSSRLLISSRAGSRQGMTSIRDPKTGKLVPLRISGGASAITADMLNGIATGASNYAKSGTVSSELVAQLLASITNILNNIAQNTAPVNKIYQALVAYLEAGGSSGASNNVVKINTSSSKKAAGAEMSDVDANIKTLVTTLAELAKG